LRGNSASHYYIYNGYIEHKLQREVDEMAAAAANFALLQVPNGLDTIGVSQIDTVVVQGAGGLGLSVSAAATRRGAETIVIC
jgi:threonine dehydrogenase-like Zn-dependent dehydrogenase